MIAPLVTIKTLSLKKRRELKHLSTYGLVKNFNFVSSGELTQNVIKI